MGTQEKYLHHGSNHLLIGPHGGHSNVFNDDGRKHPWDSVKAAHKNGIVIAMTGHNTMAGIPDYLNAMDAVGMGKLALPGVEFSYALNTTGYTEAGLAQTGQNLRIIFNPAAELFYNKAQTRNEHARIFTAEEIKVERDGIETELTTFLQVTKDEIVGLYKDAVDRLGQYRDNPFVGLSKKDTTMIKNVIGVYTALHEPGFAVFWLNHKRHVVDGGYPDELVEQFKEYEKTPLASRLVDFGFSYWQNESAKDKQVHHKGEVICLMPPNPHLLKKMNSLVEHWRINKFSENMPLIMLFNVLTDNLTKDEFDALVFNIPHPISIDASLLGRLVVKLMEGNTTLFPSEVFIEQAAKEIDTIEVYNAAHPSFANGLSVNVGATEMLKNKGRTGASDSHDPSWVRTGATLAKVDEYTSDGILDAMRRGNTLPISGLGRLSTTIFPFPLWIPTILHRTPEVYFKFIDGLTDIQTPARLALEQGLFDKRQEIPGWVYSPDGKSVQVYP